MVGKEGSDIVDIGANGYIAGLVAVMGGNIMGRDRREWYARHDENSDGDGETIRFKVMEKNEALKVMGIIRHQWRL